MPLVDLEPTTGRVAVLIFHTSPSTGTVSSCRSWSGNSPTPPMAHPSSVLTKEPDGVKRNAVLVGRRLDVEGRRIVVAGTLRVIQHPARVVGEELVLPWVEIRVEQGK
jgi:hypothetical protein